MISEIQLQAAYTQAISMRARFPMISLDALFIAIANSDGAAKRPATVQVGHRPMPDGFPAAVSTIPSGLRLTAADTYKRLHDGKTPRLLDVKNVARWLRELGYVARKSNGKLIFDF